MLTERRLPLLSVAGSWGGRFFVYKETGGKLSPEVLALSHVIRPEGRNMASVGKFYS